MTKKSITARRVESDRVVWYQWEFLRRNADYRADYAQLIRDFGKWFEDKGYWWDRSAFPYWGEEWKYFCRHIAPRFEVISKKWLIERPISPDWNFSEYGLHREGDLIICVPTGCTPAGRPSWELDEYIPAEDNDPVRVAARLEEAFAKIPDIIVEFSPRGRRYLRMEFDLSEPRQRNQERFEQELEIGMRLYKAWHGQDQAKDKKTRRRLADYESYLRVWDLRQQGRTFAQIAKQIFPLEYERYVRKGEGRLNPVTKRTRDHFLRAQELISGGYKQIR
jgi:hypothetical protein